MRLLIGTNFDGLGLGTLGTSDLTQYGVAARTGEEPYSGSNRNNLVITPTSMTTGLRGTGKCIIAPQFSIQYTTISVQYPETISTAWVSFDFKFATTVISQTIMTIGPSNLLQLNTDASGRLRANVNSTNHVSSTPLVVGTVYNCQILIQTGTSSTGKFQVRLDGFLVSALQSAAITIGSGSPNVVKTVNFSNGTVGNLHVGAPIWRGGSDAFDTSLFAGGDEEGKIARVQDLLPVADGAYTTWTRVSGPFGGGTGGYVGSEGSGNYLGDPDPTYDNDYQQVNEVKFDGFLHYLKLEGSAAADGAPAIPQSFVHAAFDEYEEDTIPAIIGVYQNMMVGGAGDDIAVPFLRIGGTDYVEEKFQNIAVAPPSGNLSQWWLVGNANSQFSPCAIAYDANPATGLPWTVGPLQALEGGLTVVVRTTGLHEDNRQKTCSSSVLSVVWVEGPSDYLYSLPLTGVGW